MSHVLQCTQFAALIFSFRPPLVSFTISYTAAGQKYWQGLPYSSTHFVAQTFKSLTTRWHGWSSSCRVPEWYTSVRRSNVSLPSPLTLSGAGRPLLFLYASYPACARIGSIKPRPPLICWNAV